MGQENCRHVITSYSIHYTKLYDTDTKAQDAVNNYLLDVQHGAGINAVYLMDRNGLTLAASNFQSASSYIGHNYGFRPYFQLALHGGLGRFYGLGATTGEPGYFLASPIAGPDGPIGVVVVKISLGDFESALVRNGDPVLLVDANGVVFLSSVPEFKYRTLMPLESGVVQQIGLSRVITSYSIHYTKLYESLPKP